MGEYSRNWLEDKPHWCLSIDGTWKEESSGDQTCSSSAYGWSLVQNGAKIRRGGGKVHAASSEQAEAYAMLLSYLNQTSNGDR